MSDVRVRVVQAALVLCFVALGACSGTPDGGAPGATSDEAAEPRVALGTEGDDDPLLPCTYFSLLPGDEDGFTEHAGCARYAESGELVVLAEHVEAATGGKERTAIRVEGRWYYLLPDGKNLEVIDYDNGPDYFSEGLTRSRRDGKISYWNEQLEMVIGPRYDWGWPFEGGLALVCSGCRPERPPGEEHTEVVGGSWGVIDARGEEVIELSEDHEAVRVQLEARRAGRSGLPL